MAETLIGELARMGSKGERDMRRVRTIRESLRTLVNQLAMLQGFYSGLSMLFHSLSRYDQTNGIHRALP